jgi:hypothetical protein
LGIRRVSCWEPASCTDTGRRRPSRGAATRRDRGTVHPRRPAKWVGFQACDQVPVHPGDVVVEDNFGGHKGEAVRRALVSGRRQPPVPPAL